MVNAEVLEMGREVVRQQKEWVDKAMFRLLPENLHYLIRQGHVSNQKILDWLRDNGVQINFFRNVPMIRITVKGVLFDEWKLRLTVEGRPVDMGKLVDPKFLGNDVFVDEKTTQENN